MEPGPVGKEKKGLQGSVPAGGLGQTEAAGFFEVTAQARAQQLFLEDLGILDTTNQDLKTS